MSTWFDDIPVIGRMPEHEAAQKLVELDDTASAETLGAEVKRGEAVSFSAPKGPPPAAGNS